MEVLNLTMYSCKYLFAMWLLLEKGTDRYLLGLLGGTQTCCRGAGTGAGCAGGCDGMLG